MDETGECLLLLDAGFLCANAAAVLCRKHGNVLILLWTVVFHVLLQFLNATLLR
jgi:hypothetical protein